MIFLEVSEKNSDKSLFRSSSLPAKVIGIYSHLIGADFLISTISSIINMVSRIKKYLDLDPKRVGEEQAERNKNALMLIANEVIGKIMISVREMPVPFFTICRSIHMSVRRVFSSSSSTAINSFIFLRFFVPAIATPEAFGIVDKNQISPINRRNLVLVSKIIQNIANQAEPMSGAQSSLNNFISQSSVRVVKLYKQFVEIPEEKKNIWTFQNYPVQESEIANSVHIIRQHISNHFDDIKDILIHHNTRLFIHPFVLDFLENLINDKRFAK
eukprot:Anaeramoba_ignava/c20953_g1_i1.p2 GENE.c20953_g1_i1~~c20953_g1_i1.p2  ORF type:complete len:271 (-),score=57.01 c20953_g1_i1:74-886(-)